MIEHAGERAVSFQRSAENPDEHLITRALVRKAGAELKDFRKLKVWERSHSLVLAVYKATSSFPPAEMYGITAQLRRSSSSIPANIAEGCGRHGDAELGRFLSISMGSASELQYHLLLAKDLGYLCDTDYEQLAGDVSDVKRMLATFIIKLRAER